jgi:hypothetical protein
MENKDSRVPVWIFQYIWHNSLIMKSHSHTAVFLHKKCSHLPAHMHIKQSPRHAPTRMQLIRFLQFCTSVAQNETDQIATILYFYAIGCNWSGCCNFVLLWHKRFLWCIPIGNNKVGSHQEIWRPENQTPTAGPSVWKMFFFNQLHT